MRPAISLFISLGLLSTAYGAAVGQTATPPNANSGTSQQQLSPSFAEAKAVAEQADAWAGTEGDSTETPTFVDNADPGQLTNFEIALRLWHAKRYRESLPYLQETCK